MQVVLNHSLCCPGRPGTPAACQGPCQTLSARQRHRSSGMASGDCECRAAQFVAGCWLLGSAKVHMHGCPAVPSHESWAGSVLWSKQAQHGMHMSQGWDVTASEAVSSMSHHGCRSSGAAGVGAPGQSRKGQQQEQAQQLVRAPSKRHADSRQQGRCRGN